MADVESFTNYFNKPLQTSQILIHVHAIDAFWKEILMYKQKKCINPGQPTQSMHFDLK